MKRETASLFPGVSIIVEPVEWLSERASCELETTVADTSETCGCSRFDVLRWRMREVIMSASGRLGWW